MTDLVATDAHMSVLSASNSMSRLSFQLLEIGTSLSLWHSLFYFGTLGPLVLMFALKPLRQPRRKPVTHAVDVNGDKCAPAQEKMEAETRHHAHTPTSRDVRSNSMKAA